MLTYLKLRNNSSVKVSRMCFAYVVAETIHICKEVMAAALFSFKVNFDLMNVFLLLFSWLFAIVSDHSVDNSEYGATSV